MKRSFKSVLGVTLLEIMLVLAIAAMIIVMSVRYYQSASQSQQANSFVEQVQNITASAVNLAQGAGSFQAVSSNSLTSVLPSGSLTPPWGGTITYAPSTSGYTLTITQPSAATCALIVSRFATNKQYTIATPCTSLTYSATGS